jgi:hypothetical protein
VVEFWDYLTNASPFTIALVVIALVWSVYCMSKILSTKRSNKKSVTPTGLSELRGLRPIPPPSMRPPPPPPPPKRVIREDIRIRRKKVKIPKNRMIRED